MQVFLKFRRTTQLGLRPEGAESRDGVLEEQGLSIPARGYGSAVSSPSGVRCGALAEIELCAF